MDLSRYKVENVSDPYAKSYSMNCIQPELPLKGKKTSFKLLSGQTHS